VNYRIVWDPDAIGVLQRIYDASGDQEGVANTVTRLGLELGTNPTQAGESRDRNGRILFKHPLVVWFRVDERMKEVIIYQVRAMRR
jgi:hypothetical protein